MSSATSNKDGRRASSGSVRSVDSRVASYVDEVRNIRTLLSGEAGEIEEVLRQTALDSTKRKVRSRSKSISPSSSYRRSDYHGSQNFRRSRSRSRSRKRSRSRSQIRRKTRSRSTGRRSRSRSPRMRRDRSPVDSVPKGRVICTETNSMIVKEITDEVGEWMTRGISTSDSKSLQDKFKLSFERSSFSLNPPAVDSWISRRLKSKSTHKTVESAEKKWLTAQFKVMDIASPLIFLYSLIINAVGKENIMALAVRAALQQWSRAFNHISRRRRHNIVTYRKRLLAIWSREWFTPSTLDRGHNKEAG
ncbi:Uncharacterized protein APZ42_010838 [Daphnia magna]|uniref:Uncharacterized protein n=1 Tax=Daphnia magna TaxID=35525 RepID=A0A162TDJ0_9CRUS|nr:Uncharacterized protein APZ42_010838 [Daphnia magna]